MHVIALIAMLFLSPPQGGVLAGTRTGVITGQVRSQSGAPVAGIRVAAMEAPEMGTQDSAVSVMAGLTLTDENGNYRLEDIPVGKYFVVAGSLNDLTFYPNSIALTTTTIDNLNIVLSDSYKGKIQVVVHHAGGASPVADADVLIQSKSGDYLRQGVTDEKGSVTIEGLPFGDYTVSTPAISIADQVAGVTPSNGLLRYLSLVVTINPDRPSWTASLGLVFPASIRGHVRDADGNPAVNATVTGMTSGFRNGKRTMIPEFTAQTNEKGEYELSASPGEHLVRVSPEAVQSDLPATMATYYPAAGDPGNGKVIVPSNGQVIDGIDIRLGRSYRVSGRIIGKEEEGETEFELISRSSIDVDVPSFRPRNLPDGSFELDGVPAGSWDLFAVVSQDNPPRYVTGKARIDIAGDTGDVSISLLSRRLSGKISGAGAKRLYVSLIPVDTITGAVNQVLPQEEETDSDGRFEFTNFPALRFRMEVYGLLPGQYVSDIRVADKGIFDDNILDLSTGIQEVEVRVESGAGSIEGVVENVPIDRAADARVIMIPENAKSENRYLFRTAVIQEGGTFSIHPDVPPGNYRIFALSRLPIGHPEWNAEFLKKYSDVMIPIQVLPGKVNAFRLQLTRAR